MTENWQVDLGLNLNTFRRDIATARNLLRGVSGRTNLGVDGTGGAGSAVASSFTNAIKSALAKIPGSDIISSLLPISVVSASGLAIGTVFAKKISDGLLSRQIDIGDNLERLQTTLLEVMELLENTSRLGADATMMSTMYGNLRNLDKRLQDYRNTWGGLNAQLINFGEQIDAINSGPGGRLTKTLKMQLLLLKNFNLVIAGKLLDVSEIVKSSRLGDMFPKLAPMLAKLADFFMKLPLQAKIAVGAIVAIGAASILTIPLISKLQMSAIQMARTFIEAHANVERLKNGLKQTAALTDKQIQGVFDLGKLPGLSKVQAAESVMKLMAGGMDLDTAKSTAVAYSNIATSAQNYGQIMFTVSQILSKSELSAEELNNQLAEAVPGFKRYLKEVFGVTNAEQLRDMGITPETFVSKLAIYFSKLSPQVSKAQSALDNFDDAIQNMKASLGAGIAQNLVPLLDRLTKKFDQLAASGKLDQLGRSLGNLIDAGAIEVTIATFATFSSAISGSINILQAFTKGFVILSSVLGGIVYSLTAVASLLPVLAAGLRALPVIGPLIGIASGISGIGTVVNKIADDESKSMKEPAFKYKFTPPIEKQADNLNLNLQNKQLEQLRDIAKNTEKDKALERSILGGGNLGAKGIGAIDLSGANSTSMGPEVDRKMRELLEAIAKTVTRSNVTAGGFAR